MSDPNEPTRLYAVAVSVLWGAVLGVGIVCSKVMLPIYVVLDQLRLLAFLHRASRATPLRFALLLFMALFACVFVQPLAVAFTTGSPLMSSAALASVAA